MVIFPGFGSWINQNIKQSLIKAESKRSENVKSKSKSASEINTRKERDDTKEQLQLWRDAEKKEPWHDAAPTVKVTKQEGYSETDVRFTIGLPPQVAYDLITNPNNQTYSKNIKIRGLLKNKSRKVMEENSKGELVWDVEKDVPLFWNFLSVPISLTFADIKSQLSGVYDKKEMMFMETFSGSWSVEPIYVDSVRLCKHMKPKSQEEYIKCSGGQGRMASKVRVRVLFQPSSPFDTPPLSWCIRGFIVKTTKTMFQNLQNVAAQIRGV